jgi:hypothetical protein
VSGLLNETARLRIVSVVLPSSATNPSRSPVLRVTLIRLKQVIL